MVSVGNKQHKKTAWRSNDLKMKKLFRVNLTFWFSHWWRSKKNEAISLYKYIYILLVLSDVYECFILVFVLVNENLMLMQSRNRKVKPDERNVCNLCGVDCWVIHLLVFVCMLKPLRGGVVHRVALFILFGFWVFGFFAQFFSLINYFTCT